MGALATNPERPGEEFVAARLAGTALRRRPPRRLVTHMLHRCVGLRGLGCVCFWGSGAGPVNQHWRGAGVGAHGRAGVLVGVGCGGLGVGFVCGCVAVASVGSDVA